MKRSTQKFEAIAGCRNEHVAAERAGREIDRGPDRGKRKYHIAQMHARSGLRFAQDRNAVAVQYEPHAGIFDKFYRVNAIAEKIFHHSRGNDLRLRRTQTIAHDFGLSRILGVYPPAARGRNRALRKSA